MLPTFFFLHNKLYFYPSSSTIRTQPQTPVRPLHPPQSLPLPLVLNPLHLYLAKAQPRATKPGRTTLCGRLGQALRSGAYVGFREGQPTLVNIAEVSDYCKTPYLPYGKKRKLSLSSFKNDLFILHLCGNCLFWWFPS